MRDDWIYDYNDKEYLYQMDDDYAIGTDGHIVRNAGDSYGFDVSDGEIHLTSGWELSGGDDDDNSGYYASSLTGRFPNYRNNKETATHFSAGNTMDKNEATGCGCAVTLLSMIIVGAILKGIDADIPGFLAFILVVLIEIGIIIAYYVIVPDPDGAVGVPAEVVESRFFSRNEVPVPLEMAKYIKEKIDAETYFALIDKRKTKVAAETTSSSSEKEEKMNTALESGKTTEAVETKDLSILNVILWIAIGVLVCVVIAALVFAAVRTDGSTREATAVIEETAAPKPTETPIPTDTPEPTPRIQQMTKL